ncbi:3'-5'-exoribonuclease [Coemansia spiralis]|uniref:3'-5'-exoribonuclease n=2 Tax=Coemansia TaxID=4863 RepID=A0A9W8G6X9_9FUNG|nr:ribosomal protein S5 domain 2-type protein [Coemansia spiralis]KAJ1991460.1 3'-5'-exoribonuclease [Coemansia umbellata]KAJ2621586.1 3'-5'-exoribonuclease [Coemansia sp. RSA 1358]KAJ2676692.1 3'-5'-exoribonuclease [Coemansia spiralis]
MSANIFDRRRVNGPPRSVEPLYTDEGDVKPFTNGGRADGRSLDQLRPIFIKTGPLAVQPTFSPTAPSGSAYYEQGKIRISCAVYGPRQGRKSNPRMGSFDCDFQYAPFSCSWKRRPHIKGADEKEIALILEQAMAPAIRLEAYPKACIDAFVTVIESDGKFATISAAINCISAALADAGIELYDIVAACSMSLNASQWVSDCNQAEEDVSQCSLFVSRMPSADEITYLLQQGKTMPDQTDRAVQTCSNSCARVYAVLSRYLQASMEQPAS